MGDLWDDPCAVFDCVSGACASVRLVLVVTDVLVSPSSVVTKVCDGFSLGSDVESVEPQSFSFFKKRCLHHCKARTHRMKRGSGKSRWRIRFGVRVTEQLLQKLSSTWKSKSTGVPSKKSPV